MKITREQFHTANPAFCELEFYIPVSKKGQLVIKRISQF